jgi:predicted unusual protein kinase regulating ubiquinone biosynthesis (AarF/ABC1/UbiB family)
MKGSDSLSTADPSAGRRLDFSKVVHMSKSLKPCDVGAPRYGDRVSGDSGSKGPTRGRVARTAALGRVAAGGAVRWAGDRLDRGDETERARRRGDRVVATIDSLVDQLAVMRGAAMKAGQVLSTIEFPGLDPDQSEYLQSRLASLRDDVPPVSWKQIRGVLEGEWGDKPENVLAEIDPEPAAAASIGQVHRGRTQEGADVAVKVQYPGIAEAVESDMRNLRMLSPLLRRLMPGLEVKDVLAELAERIAAECDYELEAAGHRRLARYWREHPFVRVPSVDTALSRRRVLVTEWVDGLAFNDVLNEPDPVRDRYAEIVYRFFYANAGELDLALGDPHPGNYLLCEDGRVAFFDFGMIRELPRGYLEREAEVFRALRDSDPARLVATLRELGYLPGPSAEWNGQMLVDQMRAAGWWFLEDRTRRLEPDDLWRGTEQLREGGDEAFDLVRRMTLPTEALLLRRMEGLLFQIATQLRAEQNWSALIDEIVAGGEPISELGEQHQAWLAERGR